MILNLGNWLIIRYLRVMKTLHMTLIRKWFDQIANGTKTEEYREIKQYWIDRLVNKNYDVIVFRNGYASNAPTMTIEYKGLSEKMITWDSGKTEKVFAIQLGKVLNVKKITKTGIKRENGLR